MNAWGVLKEIHSVCHFMSQERSGEATSSELKRWCQNKAVEINGKRPGPFDEIEFPIQSMVLFPKKKRTTLW